MSCVIHPDPTIQSIHHIIASQAHVYASDDSVARHSCCTDDVLQHRSANGWYKPLAHATLAARKAEVEQYVKI